jgi:transcriptional regulator with XRE-family HTH domain
MSWAIHHSQSEELASQAEVAFEKGDREGASNLYRLSAGITVVSATSLWFKAEELPQVEHVACRWLAFGLHRPTISEIEAGNRNVTATEITQFAEIYDVSVSWLMGEGAEKLDPQSDRLQLAFHELQKFKAEDLDKLMKVLAALREDKGDA